MRNNLTNTALHLCLMYHNGQYRHGDITPYAIHPIRVALSLEGEEDKQIALMHDLLEDTTCNIEAMKYHGFSDYVIRGVVAITHRKGLTYNEYISSIPDEFAHIKMADIRDNLLDDPSDSVIKRYQRALVQLEEKSKRDIHRLIS